MPLKWRDLFTERDGQTPCFVRILTFVGVVFLLVIEGHIVYHGGTMDPVAFGTAFTTILVGGGVGARVKLDTEATAS